MVCAKRAYTRFMEEALLNPDEKENPDELLAEIEKVLHAAGNNSEADKRIDSMSKDQLNEILQIARILGKQRRKQKRRKKKKEKTEEEQNGQQDDDNTMIAEAEQREIEEEDEITVQQ
jgi:hypothetical protein